MIRGILCVSLPSPAFSYFFVSREVDSLLMPGWTPRVSKASGLALVSKTKTAPGAVISPPAGASAGTEVRPVNDGRTAGDGIAEYYCWQRPEPPDLYAWDVPDLHVCGVTDDPAIAAGHVHNELRDAPLGTVGTVRHTTAATTQPSSWSARRVEEGVSWTSECKQLTNSEVVGAFRPVR